MRGFGVEYTIRPLRGRYCLKRYRGLSPPAIHIQSLRDWLQASRLHYNFLDPRFRRDDILVMHLSSGIRLERSAFYKR